MKKVTRQSWNRIVEAMIAKGCDPEWIHDTMHDQYEVVSEDELIKSNQKLAKQMKLFLPEDTN